MNRSGRGFEFLVAQTADGSSFEAPTGTMSAPPEHCKLPMGSVEPALCQALVNQARMHCNATFSFLSASHTMVRNWHEIKLWYTTRRFI